MNNSLRKAFSHHIGVVGQRMDDVAVLMRIEEGQRQPPQLRKCIPHDSVGRAEGDELPGCLLYTSRRKDKGDGYEGHNHFLHCTSPPPALIKEKPENVLVEKLPALPERFVIFVSAQVPEHLHQHIFMQLPSGTAASTVCDDKENEDEPRQQKYTLVNDCLLYTSRCV